MANVLALARHEPALVAGMSEGYTEGERRAHWCAYICVTSSGVFLVKPVGLREVCGRDVHWYTPRPGDPILTAKPIRNRDEAYRLAAAWASRTFAENAALVR